MVKQTKGTKKMPPNPYKRKTKTKKKKEQVIDESVLQVKQSDIKNKIMRAKLVMKQRRVKVQLKQRRREERDKLGLEKPIPSTQEMKRLPDASIAKTQEEYEEITQEEECDEFDAFFKDESALPKVLITTGLDGVNINKPPSRALKLFVHELVKMIPNASYFKRKPTHTIDDLCQFGKSREFTDLLVVGHWKNKPYSLIHVHLPIGPTAWYRISGVTQHAKMDQRAVAKVKGQEIDTYPPELILNNFATRLGLRMARMVSTLFPKKPNFVGRRVVTFHNQRDFIFFRHHRYEFSEQGKAVALQEIGPRFTLRLVKLQLGTFDAKFGEYEWYHRVKFEKNRNQFFV